MKERSPTVAYISCYPPSQGGTSIYAGTFVEALKHKTHVVVLADILASAIHKGKNAGVRPSVWRIWKKGPSFPFKISSYVRSFGPDVVHIRFSYFTFGNPLTTFFAFPILLLILRIIGKPVILEMPDVVPVRKVRQDYLRDFELFFPRRLVQLGIFFFTEIISLLVDKMVVHNSSYRRICIENYNIRAEKIAVIPQAPSIPHSSELPEASRGQAKKAFDAKGKTIILFFGYLAPYKGLETLLKAYANLSRTYPNTVLFLAGTIHPRTDPSYRTRLIQLIRTLKLEDRTFLTGFVPEQDVSILFKAADLVVLPYTHAAGASGPLRLAAHFGKAVIATPCIGIGDIVKHEETGILVPQRDEAALQRAMERVLSDRELKKELSRNIRKKAEDFSIDKAVSQTLALYRFLTKK